MQRYVKPSAARRAPGSLRQSESAYLEQTRPFYETCFGPQVVITGVLVFFFNPEPVGERASSCSLLHLSLFLHLRWFM